MTTYTTISNNAVDQDSPVTQTLMTALRDNPIAITEGASGAPRIADDALGSTVTAAGVTWVLARSGGAGAGAVGSYAFLLHLSATDTSPNGTQGSNLYYSGVTMRNSEAGSASSSGYSSAVTGTWRCMGYSNYFVTGSEDDPNYGTTLWLRIA